MRARQGEEERLLPGARQDWQRAAHAPDARQARRRARDGRREGARSEAVAGGGRVVVLEPGGGCLPGREEAAEPKGRVLQVQGRREGEQEPGRAAVSEQIREVNEEHG